MIAPMMLTGNEVMTTEIAISLLPKHADQLTGLGKEGGVLTAMSAFGKPLVDRLVKTGKFTFESELVDADRENRKTR